MLDYADGDDKLIAANFEWFGQLDEPGLSYAFNTFAVVRHKPTGRMWWCQSSGCSCPTPFEEWDIDPETLATDMNEIVPSSLAEFERQVVEFCSDKYSGHIDDEEKRQLIQRVRTALP